MVPKGHFQEEIALFFKTDFVFHKKFNPPPPNLKCTLSTMSNSLTLGSTQ